MALRSHRTICLSDVGEGEQLETPVAMPEPLRPATAVNAARPLPRYVAEADGIDRLLVSARDDDSGALTGVAGLSRVESSTVAEVFVYVMPSDRRQGIATALIERLVSIGHDEGIRRLRVRVRSGDAGAFALLSRLSTLPSIRRVGSSLVVEFPIDAL